MNNKQIDDLLHVISQQLDHNTDKIRGIKDNAIARQLEQLNFNMGVVWSMLAEIAKRLPEAKP